MRFFINAMLAFAFVVFFTGLMPLSARQLERFGAMKAEFAAAPGAQLAICARPSCTD
jgi:hypothetical protein